MKKTLLYLIIFILVQVVLAFAVNTFAKLFFKDVDTTSTTVLLIISGLSNAIIIAIFFFTKWCTITRDFIQSRPWLLLMWTFFFAIGIILPFARLEEFLPASWNIDVTHGELGEMLKSPEGYFVVCMLAPLAEEVVFRGAIIRAIREWLKGRGIETAEAWIAIVSSAILFACVHMNPAQMPHAILMGIILGWLYVKSGSIVPGTIVHWINNSTAYVFVNLYPQVPMDSHLSAYFGSDALVWRAVGFSLLIALPSLYQLITLKLRK